MRSNVRSTVRRSATAFLVAFAVGLAGCGGSDSPTGTNGGGNGGGGNGGNGNDGPAENEVHVGDNFFNPSSLTVAPETTVTWTWVGSIDHNVVWASDEHGLANGPLQSSGTHQVTMPEATGTYDYSCTIHPGMDGSIVVEEDDS